MWVKHGKTHHLPWAPYIGVINMYNSQMGGLWQRFIRTIVVGE